MSSWKKIITGIKNDAPLVKKEFVIFSAVYLVLNVLSLLSSFVMTDLTENPSSMIAFSSATILLCVLLFINLYYFQRAYSQKKNVPVRIQSVGKSLLRVIQLYAVQMLILIGVLFGFGLLFGITLYALHLDKTSLMIIVIFITVLVTFVWIYRLNFVTNIFMYDRIGWNSHAAIEESVYLIKTNASVVLPLWILSLLLLTPGIVESLQHPGIYNPHILVNILVLVVSYFTSIICVYITVQSVYEHTYCFLLNQDKNT